MLFLRLSNYQQQQGNFCTPVKPYADKRFELSVSVADVEIISHQLWEMQNYSDKFISHLLLFLPIITALTV